MKSLKLSLEYIALGSKVDFTQTFVELTEDALTNKWRTKNI